MTVAGASPGDPGRSSADLALEARIGRILTVGTYASVALLVLGVVALLVAGRSPLEGGPALDVARIPADVASLRPEGFIWLGLLGTLATPAARVIAALLGYLRLGERAMALVAALILVVIVAGIVAGSVGA